MTKLGMIAGGGALPLEILSACRAADRPTFVIRLKGYADPALGDFEGADCGLAEFGKTFKALKQARCEAVCFAGLVPRPDFAALKPDLRGLAALPGAVAAGAKGDDALLRYVIQVFEREGFTVEGADQVVGGLTIGEGPLGAFSPDETHGLDIERAMRAARAIGQIDVGQAAVCARGVTLAVEAQEGTDAMLARCAQLPVGLRGEPGAPVGVLAKAPKPGQDRRIDLPTIGPATVMGAAQAGLAGIVGEAGGLLIVDRAGVIAAADELGLFVYGLPAPRVAMSRPACVMLVAAEASGDALGAELARALRRRLGPDKVRFVGVGGARMAAEGVESPFDIGQLSILGLFEGLMAYPKVVARANEAAALAAREKPDIAVLIDSWGFTLRVASRLRRLDPALPLVKYVGPQVWASRPGRARVLARAVDHLLAIHSFDAPHFEKEGLATTFVGNPSLARDFSAADGARLRARIGAGPEDPILLLLPGSRPGEIERVMPPFEDAAALLMAERPTLRVVVPVAQSVAAQVKARLARWPHPATIVEGDEAKYDAMKAGTVALACSGTVTTELALAGCPIVVGYRVGAITYHLLKALIRTPYITLLNIAAGKAVAPEMIQGDCNGPALARVLAERLDDPALRARQIAAQNAALDTMGRGQADPSERAAAVIAGMLGK